MAQAYEFESATAKNLAALYEAAETEAELECVWRRTAAVRSAIRGMANTDFHFLVSLYLDRGEMLSVWHLARITAECGKQ